MTTIPPFFIYGACLLWLLICARVWTMMGTRNVWQRRFVAIGAGLGAGLFYLAGTLINSLSAATPPPASKQVPAEQRSAEDIQISPAKPKP